MAGSAILPRNTDDPTGQDKRERGASADFDKRLRLIRSLYVALLGRIPTQKIQVNAEVTQYLISPELLAASLDDVAAQADRILLEGGPEHLWFTEAYVQPAYQQGTAQQYANLSVQSTTYAATKPTLESILLSEPYRLRLGFLKVREYDNLKGFSSAVSQHMSQVLQDGLAIGKGARAVAADLTAQLGIESRRAELIARTEIPGALRSARMAESDQAATDLGIMTREMHMSALSPSTRATHRARHAHLYTTQQQREWWGQDGNRYNCYLPGTKVAGRFKAGSKSYYQGPALDLVIAGGADLSVTPNHPLMTAFGLVPAAEIREGDYLLRYRMNIENAAGVTALDRETTDTCIEEVFGALSDLAQTFKARVRAVDFHGDARFMNEEIDIITPDRVLTRGLDAQTAQVLDQIALIHSNANITARSCSTAPELDAVGLTSSGIVRGGSVLNSLFRCHFGISEESPLTAVPRLESSVSEPTHDYRTGNAELFAELLHRLAGHVELVQVQHIRHREFSGHVYDLEEESGLMIANGIIASNCKCSTVSVLVDADGKPLVPAIVARAQAMLARNPAPAKA